MSGIKKHKFLTKCLQFEVCNVIFQGENLTLIGYEKDIYIGQKNKQFIPTECIFMFSKKQSKSIGLVGE